MFLVCLVRLCVVCGLLCDRGVVLVVFGVVRVFVAMGMVGCVRCFCRLCCVCCACCV